MKFKMTMRDVVDDPDPIYFDEDTAPWWLKTPEKHRHSTMDNLWFWEGYIMKLPVGGVVQTDFRTIERVG